MSWVEPTKIEFARMCEEALLEACVAVWSNVCFYPSSLDYWQAFLDSTRWIPDVQKPIASGLIARHLPTVWEDDDDWSKVGAPAPPFTVVTPPPPKPADPTFINRPRVYNRDGTFTEK